MGTSQNTPAIVRTVVPILVGLAVALAAKAGLSITSASVTPVIASAVAAVYYAAVRLAEQKWPKLSILLGSSATPVYVSTKTAAAPTPIKAAPSTPPTTPPAA